MRPDLSAFLIKRNSQEIVRYHKQFKQTVALPWVARWVGTLTPVFQEYLVEIEFAPGAADGNFYYPDKPVWVTVLEPELSGREGPPPQRIPHLYRYPTATETPRLCLFWPHDREWDEFMSIADYIIPWTAEWLANYELWKVTGRWASPEAPHDVMPSNLEPDIVPDDGTGVTAIDQDSSVEVLNAEILLAKTALERFPYLLHRYHQLA